MKKLLEYMKKNRESKVVINVPNGQVNIANDNSQIEAVMNNNVLNEQQNHIAENATKVQGKSKFTERLDALMEIMDAARESYEEPITLGYLCEFLGYESENILRQYYVTNQEPDREFMEMVADKLGVNRLWLSKGANVSMFGDGDREWNLNEILLEVYKAKKIYFAIGKEGYGNCITIILKMDDIRYKFYRHSFVFHAEGGASGQNELMNLYYFIKKLVNMRNTDGGYIDYEAGYFLSEDEWLNLKRGNMYPAAIRKIRREKYKPHIMEDFLDIYKRYHTYEQYLEWYQDDFVKSQEYIRKRLEIEQQEA